MTIYLRQGQHMRLVAGKTDRMRRYYVTPYEWPYINSLFWASDPSQRVYDLDNWRYHDDGVEAWTTITDTSWVNITSLVYDAQTAFREYSDSEVTRWQATLFGHSFNSNYIRKRRGILVFYKYWPDIENADGWSDWHCEFFGYWKDDGIEQDWRNAKEWSATAEGVSQFFDRKLIGPVVLTDTNLALNQPVTTSPLLQDMRIMAGEGEFLGVPSNDPQHLVDGDQAIPLIFDNEPNLIPEQWTTNIDEGLLRINEIYLSPPIGYGDIEGLGQDYGWIEIANASPHLTVDLSHVDVKIVDRNGNQTGNIGVGSFFHTQAQGWIDTGAALAEDMEWVEYQNIAVTNAANLQGVTQIKIDEEEMTITNDASSGTMSVSRPNAPASSAGIFHRSGASIQKPATVGSNGGSLGPHGFLILCYNRRRFNEIFRPPSGTQIVEWRDGATPLDPVGGKLVLYNSGTEIDRVNWGPGLDSEAITDPGDPLYGWVYNPATFKLTWGGDGVPVPARGHSIRRIIMAGGAGGAGHPYPGTIRDNADSDRANDWVEEDVPTPGRRIVGINQDGERSLEDTCWAYVQMPTLNCLVEKEVVDGDTEITVNTTNGFYQDKQKFILVVDQIIEYTRIEETKFVLASPWSGDPIPVGEVIAPTFGGQRIDAWPLGVVRWKRKRYPVPAIFSVYMSTFPSPLAPAQDEDWESEWTLIAHIEQTMTAVTTAEINGDTTAIEVDSTAGWPESGIAIVMVGDLRRTVQYSHITPTHIGLLTAWPYAETVLIGSTVSVVITPGLTWSHPVPFENKRGTHVLILIDAMSDLSRGRLDELEVNPDMTQTPDPALPKDGSAVDDFVRYLLVHLCGHPAEKFSSISHGILTNISTSRTAVMQILRDLARRTMAHIRFGRSDNIRWRPAPEHPLGSVTGTEEDVDFTFTKSHVTLVSVDEPAETYTQVRLRYTVTGETETRTCVFPLTPRDNAVGDIYEPPDPIVVTDEKTAMDIAEAYYYQRVSPMRVSLSMKTFCKDWLHPLARIGLDYEVDLNEQDIYDKPILGKFKVVSLDETTTGTPPRMSVETRITCERIQPGVRS